MSRSLLPLPPQPDDVPWPAPGFDGWPLGEADPAVEACVEDLLDDPRRFGDTYAVVVVQGGRLRLERYAGALPSFEHEPTPVEPTTPLLSWSMAKSVTHALVGFLVADGLVDLDAPADVPEWAGDDRASITLQQLLEMRSGLAWSEDYVDAGTSDVIEMLFGSGRGDTAAFAAARSLAHEPGSTFVYSSGTTNIVTRLVAKHADVGALLRDRLFGTIGVPAVDARFDDAGTFLGSSFLHLPARDFARFGLLYLRDGVWAGERVLPAEWVDHARTLRSIDPEDGDGYGAHWWVEHDDHGTFRAQGYEGQSILVCPGKDAVVVRLGRTLEPQKAALVDWRRRLIEALPPPSP